MTNVNVPPTAGSPPRLNLLIVFALPVVLLVVLLRPGCRSSQMNGKAAPEIHFTSPTGEKGSLSGLRGSVVLVNFWASWCGPCVEEMPSLRKLEEMMAPQGVIILAVDVDETWDQAKRSIDAPRFPTRLVFPTEEKEIDAYSVRSIPMSVIVDKTGVVRNVYHGPRNWASHGVVKELESYLK